MEKLILLIFIILFVDSVIVLICNGYNQLILIKNDVNADYAKLNKEVTFRFELISQFLPIINDYISDTNKQILNELIIQYKMKVSIADIADLYYRLNATLIDVYKDLNEKGFSAPDWDKAFKDSEERINVIKKSYDDNVLHMNNTIKAPGLSIIAKIFGFTKYPFFIKAA